MTQEATVERALYRLPEAAEALGVSVRMVELLAQRGELRTVHIGRAVRVSRKEIDRYVEWLEGQ